MNREELADFLKRRRQALQPQDVGLPAGARRRTTGLRREEVAGLAHISTDFYTRLEQQRGSRPSEQTVAAISQALQLNRDERDHLLALAGHQPPPRQHRVDKASPELSRVLEKLNTPAMIVSDLYVILSQNAWAQALLGVQTQYEGLRGSMIYRWFTEPASRALFLPEDHPTHSRNYVATLRATHARAANAEAGVLVERLLQVSEEFARLWDRHEVANRIFTIKRFQHPLAGLVTLDCQVLTSDNQTERLVVLSALTPDDAQKLELLRPGVYASAL